MLFAIDNIFLTLKGIPSVFLYHLRHLNNNLESVYDKIY